MGWYSYDRWPVYVSVAQRRRQGAKLVAKLEKAGRQISPVEIAGRKIATTFWGEAWCRNLESYSDYSNRLPRGRTYVRNGSVIDLQIEPGRVRSLVSGSEIYEVEIEIMPLAKRRWTGIKGQCAGQIDSLIELLQGTISKGVMEIVTRKKEGLFPSPKEISLSCSCPDWATMCKHVASTLYGVGARLDHQPELLFALRGVDPAELVEIAVDQPPTGGKPRSGRLLKSDRLSSVFGVDIDMGGVSDDELAPPARTSRRAGRSRKKPGGRSATTRKATVRRGTNKKKPLTKKAPSRATSRAKKRIAKGTVSAKKSTVKKPAAKKARGKGGTKKRSSARLATKKKASARRSSQRARRVHADASSSNGFRWAATSSMLVP